MIIQSHKSFEISLTYFSSQTAIPVTPTLSIDGERLFVSTSTTHAFCIDTKTGQKLWDLPGASTFLAAQVSPDDQRVYFLQSIDGRLFAYEQQSGAFSWVSSCDAFEEDCSNTVRASFSLSRTGQFLFYADVLGQVLALKLAEYVTIDEDVGNGLSEEDSLNEKQPISELSETSTESTTNEGISTGGSVALIILVLLMAVSAGVSLFLIRKARGRARRKVDNAHQRSTKDDDWFETNKLKLPGPDPYEDSMLAKQSPHLELTFQNSIWVDEICQRTNDMATNDRAPKIFGTIRVTPFQAEDYSLGAAILV